MIKIKGLSFYRGGRTIFEGVDLTLHSQKKIGIVGKNGCGKTTLFKLLLNELYPSHGEIDYSPNLTFSHLEQELPNTNCMAVEYVVQGDQEFAAIEDQLLEAEVEEDNDKIIKLHMKIADIDGYTIRSRAAKILSGLGFSTEEQNKAVNHFSGGWKMRLNLARTLMSRADLLLLDEPTNHLDLDAILWLEQWLIGYKSTLLIISHDRDFLDKVTNQILHIHDETMAIYEGNYSSFESQRAEQLALQQMQHEKQQKKITHMLKYVERFRYKASKARQAQSRLKAIERMPLIEAVQQETPYHFDFKEPVKVGNPLVNLEKVVVGYKDKIIFSWLNLQLRMGQRIGLIGPNGAGKSTLIKLMVGDLSLNSGKRFVTDKKHIGYFAQYQLDLLDHEQTAMEHMRDLAPDKSERDLQRYLGTFGFSRDLALTATGKCSGGEKARLILAMIIWQRPAMLLLDEPTNHLDMEMRNALMLALQNFTGTLVVVSHDRHLLRSVSDELWLVADGEVTPFDGDLTDYRKWLFSRKS